MSAWGDIHGAANDPGNDARRSLTYLEVSTGNLAEQIDRYAELGHREHAAARGVLAQASGGDREGHHACRGRRRGPAPALVRAGRRMMTAPLSVLFVLVGLVVSARIRLSGVVLGEPVSVPLLGVIGAVLVLALAAAVLWLPGPRRVARQERLHRVRRSVTP
jgi:hypothetical protein